MEEQIKDYYYPIYNPYNPCLGCYYFSHPYWSVNNPCKNCIRKKTIYFPPAYPIYPIYTYSTGYVPIKSIEVYC